MYRFSGDNPQESKETLIRLAVDDVEPQNADDWYATSDLQSGLSVQINITPAYDAIIGKYVITQPTSL